MVRLCMDNHVSKWWSESESYSSRELADSLDLVEERHADAERGVVRVLLKSAFNPEHARARGGTRDSTTV